MKTAILRILPKTRKTINDWFLSKLAKYKLHKRHCAVNFFSYNEYMVFRKIDYKSCERKKDLVFTKSGKIYYDDI